MKRIRNFMLHYFVSELIPIDEWHSEKIHILVLKKDLSVRWFILLLKVLGYKTIFPKAEEQRRIIERAVAEKIKSTNSEIFGIDIGSPMLIRSFFLNRARQFHITIFNEHSAALSVGRYSIREIRAFAYMLVTKN